jgi:hypothetical protein
MSCHPTDVKIPVNNNQGLQEIWDNSRIYVLFNNRSGDTIADLKLGQTITTTHWLVAVDKRLKMKHLVKPVTKILKKRHKKSIHSKEGTHAYFTYLDSIRKKVSFIDFDSINIMPDYFTSEKYFQQYPKADNTTNKLHFYIYHDRIFINDSIELTGLKKNQILKKIESVIDKKQNNRQKSYLFLNVEKDVYFDKFLDFYTFFKNNQSHRIQLNPKIFIFTR